MTSDSLQSRIQALEDIEAIKQLKHRYWRYLDTQDWDGMRECFAPDARCAYEDGHYVFEGVDAIMQFLSESIDALRRRRVGMHLGYHPEIELLSPTTARGTWLLAAFGLDHVARRGTRNVAYYHDEYRKLDGEWKLQSIEYVSLFQAQWDVPNLAVQRAGEIDSRAFNERVRARNANSA